MDARAHVFVSGRVQGIFFRHSTKRMAESLNLVGWVRNLPDGRVEAVFEGDAGNVKNMVGWCFKGPPHALVEDVRAVWDEPREGFGGFFVRD
jgi:acylphosphatase